jgi:hypothetical protein
MDKPTLIRKGYMWQVTYTNGAMKEHAQTWQALIYYHQAVECYQRDVANLSALQLSQDSILDAASTSSIIPNDPSGDCK